MTYKEIIDNLVESLKDDYMAFFVLEQAIRKMAGIENGLLLLDGNQLHDTTGYKTHTKRIEKEIAEVKKKFGIK